MDKYREVKLLGRGGFGEAWLVKDKRDTRQYCLKKVNVSRMKPKEIKEAMNEISVLSVLTKHPCIVTYRESFLEKGWLCILMDFAEGGPGRGRRAAAERQAGDLHDTVKQMKSKRSTFSEETICLAIKHIHDRKILHRDLKTQNIFLTGNKKLVRVGDFGISKVLSNTGELAKTAIGTPYYLSPEICQEKPYDQKRCRERLACSEGVVSDIWAMGCLLYELLTLRHAFEGNNMRGLVVKILRGIYPPIASKYSKDVRDLVALMLSKDPRRRPTVGQILKKSFVRERISKFLSQTIRVDEFAHTMLHRPSPAIQVDHFKKERPAEILKRLKEAHRRREEAEGRGGQNATTDLSANGQQDPSVFRVGGANDANQRNKDHEEMMARDRQRREQQQQQQQRLQKASEERAKREREDKMRREAAAKMKYEKEKIARQKKEQEHRARKKAEAEEKALREALEKQARDERVKAMREQRLKREAKQRKQKEEQERRKSEEAAMRKRQDEAKREENARKRRADDERRRAAVQADIEARRQAGARKRQAAEAEAARVARQLAEQQAAEAARQAQQAAAGGSDAWNSCTAEVAPAQASASPLCETQKLDAATPEEKQEHAEATMMRRLQEFKDRASQPTEDTDGLGPAAETKKGLVVDTQAQSMVHRLQAFQLNRENETDDDGGTAERANEAEMTMLNRLKKFQQARDAMDQDLPEPLSPLGIARETAERQAAQAKMEQVVQQVQRNLGARSPKDKQLILDIEGIKAANDAAMQADRSPRYSPRNSPRASPRNGHRKGNGARRPNQAGKQMDRYEQRAAERAQKELLEMQMMEDHARKKAEFKKKQEDKKQQKLKEEKEHRERLVALRAANRRESSVKEMIDAHKAAAKQQKADQVAKKVQREEPQPVASNPELDARRQKREEQRKAMHERMEQAKRQINDPSGFDFELVLDKRADQAPIEQNVRPPVNQVEFELVLDSSPKRRHETAAAEEEFSTAAVAPPPPAPRPVAEPVEFSVEREFVEAQQEMHLADEDSTMTEAQFEEEADNLVNLMQSMHECLEDPMEENGAAAEDEVDIVSIPDAPHEEVNAPVEADPDMGLGRLISDGKTLVLPNVGSQDSLCYQIESLRMYLEQKLQVYRVLEGMSELDDEDVITQQVAALMGPSWHEPFQLVVRLLLCEDELNRQCSA